MGRSTLLLLTLLSAACGGRVEQLVLRGYFDLCAAADDVALANVATVALDPRRDGVVGHFDIVRIAPSTSKPRGADPAVTNLSLQPVASTLGPGGAVLMFEDVEVIADLHREGEMRRRPLTVTLGRVETPEQKGRWIVVRLVLDGRTLPATSSGPPSGTAR